MAIQHVLAAVGGALLGLGSPVKKHKTITVDDAGRVTIIPPVIKRSPGRAAIISRLKEMGQFGIAEDLFARAEKASDPNEKNRILFAAWMKVYRAAKLGEAGLKKSDAQYAIQEMAKIDPKKVQQLIAR